MSLIGQTTVIAMRDPLALSSLSRNPDFFFQNFKNFKKIQNFKIKKIKVLKFKISKISKKLVVTM